MRYDDFVQRQKQALRDLEERLERDRPARVSGQALIDCGSRRYELAPYREVVVYANLIEDGVSVRIQDHGGTTITSADVARIAAAVTHIEQWIAGEIDELAPSGPWPPVVPS